MSPEIRVVADAAGPHPLAAWRADAPGWAVMADPDGNECRVLRSLTPDQNGGLISEI